MLTLTGVISGGNLAIGTSGGTVVLTNQNTYTGVTTVSQGGNLELAAGSTLASKVIFSNGMLDVTAVGGLTATGTGSMIGGSGTVSGQVSVGSGGALVPGNIGSAGTLSVNGNLNFSNNSAIKFDVNASGGASDLVSVNGNLSLSGNTAVSLGFLAGTTVNHTYEMIRFAGALTGSLENLTLTGLPAGMNASLSSPNAHEIDVTVSEGGGGGGRLPPNLVDPGVGNVVLEADPYTGKLYIVGHNANINSYEVDSASGKLTFQSVKNHGGYNTLAAQTTTGALAGSNNPAEDTWSLISNGPGTYVAEVYPPQDNPGFDIIGPGLQVFDLNVAGLAAWTAGTPLSDLTFQYGDGTGATISPGVINMFEAIPEPTSFGVLAIAVGALMRRRRRNPSRISRT